MQQPIPTKARVIANYLPQFHPIPENDRWWGKGFTEWTNVAKAKPCFDGHFQPNVPTDLGFYDLRVPEARQAQADLARENGIEGFCYWHYWFAGERLLERPFDEVVASGKPNFPFCLGWANHTWSAASFFTGDERKIIKEQTYPGNDDYARHFQYLLRAFSDPRYIHVEGKPLLVIYRPLEIPNCRQAMDFWRELASKNGLDGLHIVATLDYGQREWDAAGNGFDAITVWPIERIIGQAKSILPSVRLARQFNRRPLRPFRGLASRYLKGNEKVFDYQEAMTMFLAEKQGNIPVYQMAIPNWDTTPRYGNKAIVLNGSTPELFRRHLRQVLEYTLAQPVEHHIIFAKSWNEWAEGNYLEPDLRFGRAYLDVLREEISASGPGGDK